MSFQATIEVIGETVDAAGVVVMLVGMVWATIRYAADVSRREESAYRSYRHGVGRAILLGLEFLVAGDIIRTVVVAPTMETVSVLGLIVLIRTFLSFSLEVELEGRWPWKKPGQGQKET